jgi:hypothetical protein
MRIISEKRVDKVQGKEARFECWGQSLLCLDIAWFDFGFFNRAMFKTIVLVLSALFFPLFPAPAPAQCNEQLCRNLQAILDEAVTDFRGYRVYDIRLVEFAPGASVLRWTDLPGAELDTQRRSIEAYPIRVRDQPSWLDGKCLSILSMVIQGRRPIICARLFSPKSTKLWGFRPRPKWSREPIPL